MNGLQMPLAVGLAAIAAGAVAYVVLTPLLSGESRAAKRRQAVSVVTSPAQRVATASRREQVARSLKEVEAKRGGTKVSLELKIARAGLDWTKQKFYAVSALMAVATGLVVFVLTAHTFATLAGLFAGAFGLPLWLLSFLRKKRIKAFITELPTAIDIITRGVRSGIPVGDCFRIIAREAQEPIRGEFRQVVESQTMGLTLGDAHGADVRAGARLRRQLLRHRHRHPGPVRRQSVGGSRQPVEGLA